MINKQFLQKIIDYGLLCILVVFPFFINIALFSPKDTIHPIIAINISLADLLIGLVLLVWLLKLLVWNEWKQIKLPPVPIFVFIGVGIASFVNALSIIQWLKEIVQSIEYFIVLYILLINNIKTLRLQTLKNIMFVFVSIILIVAFIQHTILNGDSYFVRGLFANHNILGSYLCITIPLVYSEMLYPKRTIYRVWMVFLLALSIIVLTSGSSVLSLLISLLIINWLYDKKVFLKFIAIILVIGVLYPFIMPQKDVNAIKKFMSIYEQGSIKNNYYRRLALIANSQKNTLLKKRVKDNYLVIKCDDFFSVKMPDIIEGKRYGNIKDQKHIKNRYLEMQASLNMISDNPLIGIGLGNYQKRISYYFKVLPKIDTAEPGQNNTYLIIASTMGLFGLAVLIWVLGQTLRSSFTNYRKGLDKEKLIFFLGLTGSVIAIIIEGFFSYLFVNNLLVPIILIFYLSNLKIT